MTDTTADITQFQPAGFGQDDRGHKDKGRKRDGSKRTSLKDHIEQIHPGMFLVHRNGAQASARAIGVAAVSGVITFFLFLTMQGLVDFSEGSRLDESTEFRLIDVVEDIPDVQPRFVERSIEKPVEVELPPEMPEPVASMASSDAVGIDLSISIPKTVSRQLSMNTLTLSASADGDYMPLVRIQPQYPRRALEKGIEGYVIIELTVAADGSVEHDSVRVREAKPAGIFDRSAIAAARKFKYKPKTVNGKGVAVDNVSYLFTFEMDS